MVKVKTPRIGPTWEKLNVGLKSVECYSSATINAAVHGMLVAVGGEGEAMEMC
jgi:hypothetical protein